MSANKICSYLRDTRVTMVKGNILYPRQLKDLLKSGSLIQLLCLRLVQISEAPAVHGKKRAILGSDDGRSQGCCMTCRNISLFFRDGSQEVAVFIFKGHLESASTSATF